MRHVQNPPDQNPSSQIWEPFTVWGLGLGVTVIVKNKEKKNFYVKNI